MYAVWIFVAAAEFRFWTVSNLSLEEQTMNTNSMGQVANESSRLGFWLFITTVTALFLSSIFPVTTSATENFYSNPTTLYPPACATNYQISDQLPWKGSDITSGLIHLQEAADKTQIHDVNIRVYRRGCSEPGRSILMFEMSVVDDMDGVSESVLCPVFQADRFGSIHGLRGTKEPNSWVASDDSRWVAEGETLTMFLDGISIYDADYDESQALSIDEYNGDWELKILDPRDQTGYRVDIPEYRDQHMLSELPLSGRLSGTWVVSGVRDQGFVIAFQELASEVQPFVFLSWYTYDQDGRMLWLTGGKSFEIGDSRVEIPIDYVTDGEFMGSKIAERAVKGTAVLTAVSCNNIRLEYDLSAIGLGTGTRRLERFSSVETQGYACRDAEARLEALK
jgi:hypothetical protein